MGSILLMCWLIRINIIILRHFLYLLMSRPTTIYAVSMRSIFHFRHHFILINHIFIMFILYNDFQLFGVQWCLMVALAVWPESAWNEIFFTIHKNNWSRCLLSVTLKFFQKSLWDSLVLVYCQFKNYFTLITKEKLSRFP